MGNDRTKWLLEKKFMPLPKTDAERIYMALCNGEHRYNFVMLAKFIRYNRLMPDMEIDDMILCDDNKLVAMVDDRLHATLLEHIKSWWAKV